MTVYEIPLSPSPQMLSIALSGVTYQLTFHWNKISAAWLVDFADASGNPIVGCIPLLPGVNLLEAFPELGFDGQLLVQTDFDPDAVPTFDNLGVNGHVYWVPNS